MLDAAQDAARKGDACVRDIENLQKNLSQLSTPEAAIREARRAKELMQKQSETMATTLWGTLRLSLYEILLRDMKDSVQKAADAYFHSSHLTVSEKQRYEQAVRQFHFAYEAACEADTLIKATQEVSNMRFHGIEMRNVSYRHRGKNG